MAIKYTNRVFVTREAAEQHQKDRGVRGYSEEYGEGVFEVTLEDGTIGYVSKKKVFYG